MNIEITATHSDSIFHWPAGTEEYGSCIEVRVALSQSATPQRLNVAYGFREAFGKLRRRILVFRNESDVLAEFVGVDDWVQSKQVVTFLRQDGTRKYLRPGAPVSSRYGQFNITESSSAVTGPYAPQCVAALVDEGDITTLVAIALSREEGERAIKREEPSHSEPIFQKGAVQAGGQSGAKAFVVQALLDYRAGQKIGGAFTKNRDADNFLRTNSFAFLMAASIDRGAVAESVWEIPYLLNEKLGHLDPQLLSRMSLDQLEEVLRSLNKRPRFPNQSARTISSLSKLVMEQCSGDTVKIWQNKEPLDIVGTLEKIWGVGPGIAHMIVRILKDEFGYDPGPIGLRQIDVKPDVHVVRLFYRTGLIQHRSGEACIQAARELSPEFPGLLDWPAWEIGRTWCHEHKPECGECPLCDACPKIVV